MGVSKKRSLDVVVVVAFLSRLHTGSSGMGPGFTTVLVKAITQNVLAGTHAAKNMKQMALWNVSIAIRLAAPKPTATGLLQCTSAQKGESPEVAPVGRAGPTRSHAMGNALRAAEV